MNQTYPGPLAGLRVVEFAGIGPAPFAGMLLAQLGAEVVRLDRPKAGGHELLPIDPKFDFMNRGKPVLTLDLKSPEGIARALAAIDAADVLVEGFRPGVMERLGLGPDLCRARNPRLIYGRVTGWGQTGPFADQAGHDITYIALTGVLNAIGENGRDPVPPLNLVGDFAGGALYLVIGILAAREEARRTGRGQVIDAAMLDGASHLMTFVQGLRQAGFWSLDRGSNQPDGGFPFNAVYRTADGKYLAVAAAEMKFRHAFIARLGLDAAIAREGDLPTNWPRIKALLAEVLATDTRDNWVDRLSGRDTCVAPVLDLDEAPRHAQCRARGLFDEADGVKVPTVAPKFSNGVPAPASRDAEAILNGWIGDDRRSA